MSFRIDYKIGISLLHKVSLPESFNRVYSSSIENVSTALTSLIHHPNASCIDLLPSTTSKISIPDGLWYNETCLSKILNRFSVLEELDVGDQSMNMITKFDLSEMSHLQKLKIGKNSFTKAANTYGYDSSRSFEVRECPVLQSVLIGDYSFSDYASTLRIEDCPMLESIQFGKFSFVNTREVYIKSILLEHLH